MCTQTSVKCRILFSRCAGIPVLGLEHHVLRLPRATRLHFSFRPVFLPILAYTLLRAVLFMEVLEGTWDVEPFLQSPLTPAVLAPGEYNWAARTCLPKLYF